MERERNGYHPLIEKYEQMRALGRNIYFDQMSSPSWRSSIMPKVTMKRQSS